MTNPELNNADSDKALRPDSFNDFLGQEEAKLNLHVYVKAALSRGEVLDHILLSGPPGLGKTTLASILAHEMNSKIVVINAPAIKTKGELSSVLASLNRSDILFLDEIHSLNNKIEEVLYPAMEDFKLEVVAGNLPLTIDLCPFTLIGATTRAGMLQRPLRDRFGVVVEMQFYTEEELMQIIHRSANKLGMTCNEEGALELAKRSRGTPRLANRLLRRVRDFAQFNDQTEINKAIVNFTCQRLGIDSVGLDTNAQRYLSILAEKDKPLSLTTFVSILGESKDTIENVVESLLMKLNFIEKTPKGRILTSLGKKHLQNN